MFHKISAAHDSHLPLDALERARDDSAQLCSLGEPMSDAQLQLRAELVAKIIETRTKLRMIRDKAEELQLALERFTATRGTRRA
ncbi:MAG TPA: hypothetical protein VFS55_10980 [Dokdonella sp.]|nr:hypothetical protein [Dokdonella sp.]